MSDVKIGFVTFPISKASAIPLYNILKIFTNFTNQVFIITGNGGFDICQQLKGIQCESIYHITGSNSFTRIYNYIKAQFTITYYMIKISRNINFWIFPIGSDDLLPCMLLAKIQRKSAIMILSSTCDSMTRYQSDFLAPIVVLFSKINLALATSIIVYSPRLISEWNLEAYRHKIIIAHRHFLDFNSFTKSTSYLDRPPIIGYLGRLSEEKGILNFVQALPTILNDRVDFRIIIGGDGQLRKSIEKTLKEEGLIDRVKFNGWISHDDLPKYLNQLRLLVLPSYTEGLPNIMLEAMACGTPVLATSVGAIPDVIIDTKTGFIMENNLPNCIAENVTRSLNYPNIEDIVENARQYVEDEFKYENVIKRWKEIMGDIK